MSKLALLEVPKAVSVEKDLFSWPIVTPRMEEAVLEGLRRGKISDLDITVEFEKDFASWLGVILKSSEIGGRAPDCHTLRAVI